jgi:hypothetical protein
MNEIDRDAISIMRDASREKIDWIKGRLVSYALPEEQHIERIHHWSAVENRISEMCSQLRKGSAS